MAWTTLILLYTTVLAGSVVRATGSGMGCPDWPRCFGQWIPPTDVSQLPPDYKTIFKTAKHEVAEFNVIHTWTEYLNRLFGAAGGLTMLWTAILAWRRREEDSFLPKLLFTALFLFGLVSWLGSVVVQTNLKPKIISLHSLAAIGLTSVAVITCVRLRLRAGLSSVILIGPGVRALLWATLMATAIQILLGTQVRENLEHVTNKLEDCCRETWIDKLGPIFLVHKISAWVLVVLGLVTFTSLRAHRVPFAWMLPTLLGGEYAAGVILTRFAVPAAVQPVHMLLATLLFGLLVALLASTRRGKALPLQPVPAGGTL